MFASGKIIRYGIPGIQGVVCKINEPNYIFIDFETNSSYKHGFINPSFWKLREMNRNFS